jgi:hypothetical protein
MLLTSPCTRRQFLGRSAAAAAAGLLVSPVSALAAAPSLPYFERRGWLVGCWTRPWAAFDYRVGMDAMAEAGFKHIALTGAKTRSRRVIAAETTLEEAAEVGEEAQRRGLTITNVYGGGVSLEKGPRGSAQADRQLPGGPRSVGAAVRHRQRTDVRGLLPDGCRVLRLCGREANRGGC